MNRILTPERELITTGLNVWLRLNENTGSTATDSSDNGNSGTIVGSPSWITGGAPVAGGYGLELSGTGQWIDLDARVSTFNINAPVSITAWLRPDTDTPNTFFFLGNDGFSDRFFVVYLGNGVSGTLTNELITASLLDNGSNEYIIGYQSATRTELYDGGWHHLALVSTGSAWSIYLGGASKSVTVGSGSNNGKFRPLATSPDTVRVGCRDLSVAPDSLSFDGGLDDFRFYNRALSAAEIAAIAIGRG